MVGELPKGPLGGIYLHGQRDQGEENSRRKRTIPMFMTMGLRTKMKPMKKRKNPRLLPKEATGASALRARSGR